jgi:D-alanyl-D-alanine carboxypeptidase/D-alanyl-D-alanine-endopeptidase (penicillin-binding protein 4)
MVELLRYASAQPWGKEFHESLPAAGVDGSLADRCKDLDPAARVYAKTGSLDGVKTLSGYAVTAKGEQVAFAILANNLNLPGKQVNDAIDRVIEAAVNGPAK